MPTFSVPIGIALAAAATAAAPAIVQSQQGRARPQPVPGQRVDESTLLRALSREEEDTASQTASAEAARRRRTARGFRGTLLGGLTQRRVEPTNLRPTIGS